MLGVNSKIFMPTTAPIMKVDAVRNLGAEVVLVGSTFDEASEAMQECAKAEGRVIVHPFDDPLVIGTTKLGTAISPFSAGLFWKAFEN